VPTAYVTVPRVRYALVDNQQTRMWLFRAENRLTNLMMRKAVTG
jgi:hypothetical protein